MNQVFPFLMNTPLGSPDVEPDIAESAEFTSPTEYTVNLKPDLKWANGNDLTSSDVKFTLRPPAGDRRRERPVLAALQPRQRRRPPTTPPSSSHLKSANDQVFPQILSSPAGPIVDEDVFSADRADPGPGHRRRQGLPGQYVITNYDLNNLVSYEAYPDYQGLLGPAEDRARSTSSTTPTPRT